jgi:recombinational DNA repair protein RecR
MSNTTDMAELLLIAAHVIDRQARTLAMHGLEPDPAAEETMAAISDAVGPVNRCVCCNAIIPEGRQVCPVCERRAAQ